MYFFSSELCGAVHSLQLVFEVLVVGPGGVHVLVALISFHQVFLLFVFLMVVGEHFLMGLSVDHWLSLWGSTSSLDSFDDQLGFLIFAKIALKSLRRR